MTKSSYFLQYLIQLLFLSVGFWLLDLPHLVVNKAKDYWYGKGNYVDNYAFDLGYHISYALTVLLIGILYGTICPLIPAFCAGFFWFKYYVDKYNLSFVYREKFLGVGVIKRKVLPLSFVNVVLCQVILISYFKNDLQSTAYVIAGYSVILLELIFVGTTRFIGYRKRRQKIKLHEEVLKET